jgi:hypothetical protein
MDVDSTRSCCGPGGCVAVVESCGAVPASLTRKDVDGLTFDADGEATVMDALDTAQQPRLNPPRLDSPSEQGPSGPVR